MHAQVYLICGTFLYCASQICVFLQIEVKILQHEKDYSFTLLQCLFYCGDLEPNTHYLPGMPAEEKI